MVRYVVTVWGLVAIAIIIGLGALAWYWIVQILTRAPKRDEL